MTTFLGNLRKRNVSPSSEAVPIWFQLVPRQFPPIANCIRVSWNWNLTANVRFRREVRELKYRFIELGEGVGRVIEG